MKFMKKTIALIAAIALFATPFLSNSITAKAEGPTTYTIKYVDHLDQWRFQPSEWTLTEPHRELYYMYQEIKDGDIVVISGGHKDLILDLNVRLSNLTTYDCSTIVVNSKGIDNAYILNQSTVAINGDVTYAEVYGTSNVNFNNNVGTLKILSENEEVLRPNVSVVGTVNHLYGAGKSYKHFEFYNFEANSLRIQSGSIVADVSKYSKEPVSTPAPTPSAPTTGTSGEYDDVPKTGDMSFNPLWLVGMAVICMVGAYKLREE